MLKEFLNIEKQFHDFSYPKSFLKVIELSLIDLDTWYILDNTQVLLRLEGLRKRYPRRDLIPFARRDDSDDIACFEVCKGPKVFIIHDYADDGWENRKEFPDFWVWFKTAINEMIANQQEDENNGI